MIDIAIVIAVALGLLWAGQRALIYFPTSDVPAPAAVGLPQAESISFVTEDGLRLEGWFVPARVPPTCYTVIVFNGNGGHRGYRADLAGQLSARGL